MLPEAAAAAWLLWYGYNGQTAAAAFAAAGAAAPLDVDAAIGESVALGPDLNTEQRAQAFERAHQVLERVVRAPMTPKQLAIFSALRIRYSGAPVDGARNEPKYRTAIARASDAFSDDATLAVIAAEALAEANDATRALTYVARARADDPTNVMAAHLCIHEDSAEHAVPCAQLLDAARFSPATEHLAHMPAHTWIQIGDYARAVASSERAWQLIEALPANDPHRVQYRAHDLYVGYTAAMMGTQYDVARTWALREAARGDTSAPAIAALRFGAFADVPADERTPWIRAYRDARTGHSAHSSDDVSRVENDVQLICDARAFEAAGHATTAEAAYRKAIALQHARFGGEMLPVWPAEVAQGGFYLRARRYDDALTAFNAGLRRYPHDPRAESGIALVAQARADGAPPAAADTL